MKGKNPKIFETNSRHSEHGEEPQLPHYGLTITEKKRILLNNIFGVDIDSQAVEVTKLSLLLKVLEGESSETLDNQYRLFHERALPDLANNIKCGNSLIGPDFYNNLDPACHSREGGNPDELRDKINAFDWHAEFPQIFSGKNPGFDAVIGNPPYIRIQGFPREQVRYFTDHYFSALKNFDIYVIFVERAYSLLKVEGLLGFILPNKFFRTDYGEGLRLFLSSQRSVTQVVDFKASQVFGGSTYTCLLFLAHSPKENTYYAESESSRSGIDKISFTLIPASSLGKKPWSFHSSRAEALLQKIQERSVRLLDLPAYMSRGSSTGADTAFILENDTLDVESEILRTPLFASDFGRYNFSVSHSKSIIFPYDARSTDYPLYSESDLRKRFPKAFKFLSANRRTLEKRKQYKKWYAFSAPRNLALHDIACIAVPLLANHGSFALIPTDLRGMFCPMASGGFTISLPKDSPFCPEYILGIINSKLIYWSLEQRSNIFRGGWITCTKQYFGELPIRIPDSSKKRDKQFKNQMISLVEQMLDLHKKLADAKVPDEKTRIQRQIDATDKQIDKLVYDLYGLTEEEIKIVENSSK